MIKTKHEGLYYRLNKLKQKVFIARYKINNKQFKKVIGKEPQYNITTAYQARQRLIDSHFDDSFKEDTISNMFEKYISTFEAIRNPEWAYNYRMAFRKHCKPFADKLPSKVTSGQMQAIINDMIANGLKPKTAKTFKDMLSAFYAHIKRLGYDGSVPTINVEIPKFDNARDLSLTLEQIQSLVQAVKEYPDDEARLYFIFLLHGRRRLETLKLKWDDIDFHTMSYTIKAENSKVRRTFQYPITQWLYDELSSALKSRDLIFNLSIAQAEKRFKWLKERAGIVDSDFRTHDFRHITGTVAVNNGLSLEQIGKALGHTSVNTTKRYSNVRLKQASAVVENVLDTITKV